MKHMRATDHFIAVFSLLRLNKKKRNSEKHTGNIFGAFGFSKKESKTKRKEREKQKQKNYLHGKAPNKQKKNKEIFLGFLLILQLIKLERKTKKKQDTFFGFSQSFSNT